MTTGCHHVSHCTSFSPVLWNSGTGEKKVQRESSLLFSLSTPSMSSLFVPLPPQYRAEQVSWFHHISCTMVNFRLQWKHCSFLEKPEQRTRRCTWTLIESIHACNLFMSVCTYVCMHGRCKCILGAAKKACAKFYCMW